MISGVGSRRCTVRCASGFAADGVNCGKLSTQSLNFNTEVSFDFVVSWPGGFIGIQNFMVVGRGALWHQDGLQCLAGDTTQPGTADGSTPRFGRIGGAAAVGSVGSAGLLISEPDAGTMRLLRPDGHATTLPFRYDWAPGAVAAYDGNVFLVTDAVKNCIWKLDIATMNRTIMSAGWMQPTRIAVINPQNVTVVLDSAGVWKMNASGTAEKVCGGQLGTLGGPGACSQMNFIKTGVYDMAAGVIGTNVTVALLHRNNSLLLLDLNTRTIKEIFASTRSTTITAILWPSRLYIVVDKKRIMEASAPTVCACDDGLYCLQNQCVFAPVGTYADAWKAPVPCPPGSAPNLEGDCESCPNQPAFSAPNNGLSCELYTAQPACAAGKYRQTVLLGGACADCPPGTRVEGGDNCVPNPACPGAIFDGQVSCRNDTSIIIAETSGLSNITDMAVTAGGTVFVSNGTALWRNGVEILHCPHGMDVIAIADDEATFYHAALRGAAPLLPHAAAR
jgi:hypothetical protein